MSHSPYQFVSLGLAAFCAGVVNSVAGGGTLLTFPALLTAFAGLNPVEAAVLANATSTVALVPGSLASAWGYRRHMGPARRWLLLLIWPSIIGGIIGSLLVTRLDPATFSALVPWLLLLAATLFLVDTLLPKKTSPEGPGESEPSTSGRAVAGLVFFQLLVSIYGGYFGAGAGILMLSSLAMMGIGNMHQMNAVKTLLGVAINGVSSAIFIMEGKVDWPFALGMALTATLGGYLGARVAVLIRPRYVRWGVIVIAFGLAGYYFYKKYAL